MRKYKRGFTLVEIMIGISLLIILFIALYDLYMKNLVIYEKNKTKVKVEMEVKNFSDSLYTYMKGAYQDSIKIENNETIFMILPQEGEKSYIEISRKDNYIEIVSGNEKNSDKLRVMEGIVKKFSIDPLYTKGILKKLTVVIEYEFSRNKTDEIIIDYTIRN